jgi:hypothetical protein
MSVSCRAHDCIFLSFLLKRQKITTVGSEQPENITFHGKRQKKSAMGRSVPKRWAQVDFTALFVREVEKLFFNYFFDIFVRKKRGRTHSESIRKFQAC